MTHKVFSVCYSSITKDNFVGDKGVVDYAFVEVLM